MAESSLDHVVRQLRVIAAAGHYQNLTDGQLLELFVESRDEQAFKAIVRRHSNLVFGVSRRFIGSGPDVDDVFQAVFMVLARKASCIRWQPSVASWLYGVTFRLARKMRARLWRRRRREEAAITPENIPQTRPMSNDPAELASLRELSAVLDAEVQRLPQKNREAIVLCHLEGLSALQAAQRLGCPLATLKSRLERGRELLRQRLQRRGVTLSAAGLAVVFAEQVASAAVPLKILASATEAAVAFAAKPLACPAVSLQAASLARQILRTPTIVKLLLFLTAMATTAFIGLGAALIPSQSPIATPSREKKAPMVAEPAQPVAAATDLYGDPLPPGALQRLGTVRFRPGWISPFGASAVPLGFASRQTVAAVVKYGHSVQIWDAESGKLLREIYTGPVSIYNFAVSANGNVIAVSGILRSKEAVGNTQPVIAILDVSSGKEMRLLQREVSGITRGSLALTPDGKHLVSIDKDGVLLIEEVATGKEIRRHQLVPRSSGDGLTVSADGSTLVISGGVPPRQLFVWNWQTADRPRELRAPADPEIVRFNSQYVAISSDNRLVAEAGETVTKADKNKPGMPPITASVRIWEVATGQIVRKLPMPGSVMSNAVAITPDGKAVIASARGSTKSRVALYIWDILTGKLQREVEQQVGALAVSPDSRLFAGATEGAIAVWDLATGKQISANDDAHVGVVSQVAAAGNLILTGSSDQTARLWNAKTAKQLFKFTHGGRIRAVALSPDSTKALTSGMDDSVCVWDAATGAQLYKLPGHGKTGMFRAAAGFTPDGKFFFSCADNLVLRKWETATGKSVLDYKLEPEGVKIPDLQDPKALLERVKTALNLGSFSPDGGRYVLPVAGNLHVFDVATGKDVQQIPVPRYLSASFSIAISPDSKLILRGGHGAGKNTHTFTLYERETGHPRQTLEIPFELPNHSGPATFSPDGKLYAVASGEPERKIRLHSVADGKEVGAIKGFRGNVESLTFTADSRRLISGMDDTTAIIWDLASREKK